MNLLVVGGTSRAIQEALDKAPVPASLRWILRGEDYIPCCRFGECQVRPYTPSNLQEAKELLELAGFHVRVVQLHPEDPFRVMVEQPHLETIVVA